MLVRTVSGLSAVKRKTRGSCGFEEYPNSANSTGTGAGTGIIVTAALAATTTYHHHHHNSICHHHHCHHPFPH